jgi:flavin reductase (DIM6/NTAB) family NADH-FMN oxidoreductase RutF
MVTLDPKKMRVSEIYRLMIGAIVPRPIAWISTVSPKGVTNLAPFSYFNAVSSAPPCLSVSIAHKPDGSKKDTLRNIEALGEFVVQIPSVEHALNVNLTAADFEYGVSEIEAAGLRTLPSDLIRPPRIADAKVQLECRLLHALPVGAGGAGATTLVVGEIVRFHFSEDVYGADGTVRLEALDPLSRLGGLAFGKTREAFELPRVKPNAE